MKELLKDLVGKFALPVLAASCIGMGGALYSGLQSLGSLDTRLAHVELQINRHEKALDKDFMRHEQTVAEISHKTDDQERRLTRLEALVSQTQEMLTEIRSDVKILLRGSQQ